MQKDIETFFKEIKRADSIRHIPPFEEFVSRRHKPLWIYGLAAVITLIAVMLVFIRAPETHTQFILDTDDSPTVTNTLNEQQEETFLEWQAPSDYLIEDFN